MKHFCDKKEKNFISHLLEKARNKKVSTKRRKKIFNAFSPKFLMLSSSSEKKHKIKDEKLSFCYFEATFFSPQNMFIHIEKKCLQDILPKFFCIFLFWIETSCFALLRRSEKFRSTEKRKLDGRNLLAHKILMFILFAQVLIEFFSFQ